MQAETAMSITGLSFFFSTRGPDDHSPVRLDLDGHSLRALRIRR